jgi:hypothetical protein
MATDYASPGAVNQHGGNLPIKRCKRCGNEIVWATSKRTGRAYPVDVSHGEMGQRFYIGSNIHKCQEILDRRAAEDRAEGIKATFMEMLQDWHHKKDEVVRSGGDINKHIEALPTMEQAAAKYDAAQ